MATPTEAPSILSYSAAMRHINGNMQALYILKRRQGISAARCATLFSMTPPEAAEAENAYHRSSKA